MGSRQSKTNQAPRAQAATSNTATWASNPTSWTSTKGTRPDYEYFDQEAAIRSGGVMKHAAAPKCGEPTPLSAELLRELVHEISAFDASAPAGAIKVYTFSCDNSTWESKLTLVARKSADGPAQFYRVDVDPIFHSLAELFATHIEEGETPEQIAARIDTTDWRKIPGTETVFKCIDSGSAKVGAGETCEMVTLNGLKDMITDLYAKGYKLQQLVVNGDYLAKYHSKETAAGMPKVGSRQKSRRIRSGQR